MWYSLTFPSVRPSASRCSQYWSGSSASGLLMLCRESCEATHDDDDDDDVGLSRHKSTRKARTQLQFREPMPDVEGRQNSGSLKMFLAQNWKRSHSVALTEDSEDSQLSIFPRARKSRLRSFSGRSLVLSHGTTSQGQSTVSG